MRWKWIVTGVSAVCLNVGSVLSQTIEPPRVSTATPSMRRALERHRCPSPSPTLKAICGTRNGHLEQLMSFSGIP